MKHIHAVGLTLLLASGLSSASSRAADSPAEFHVGTLDVHRHGDHGAPLILIPGLACGGWVWDDTIARHTNDHVLYVVTLAGFDGAPPVKGKLLDLADDSLAQLIRTQHLDRPVLIGHSLGGTLAIQFAEKHPDLISGVLAADGLPVFPTTESMTAGQRLALVENVRTQMSGATPAQFAARQRQYMKNAVLSEARAAEIATRTSRSDPAATAQYMSKDLALDLRPGLAAITVPLLEISPFNAADPSNPAQPLSETGKTDYYKTLLQGVPKLEVVSISPARHFMMFDQPEAFAAALDRFLARLPAGK